MGEDMTYGGVDWVSVMFHAAKEIGAENRRLRAEIQRANQYSLGMEDKANELAELLAPIRKMYEEHPYASAKSLGLVIEEMVKLWEENNTPF